MRSSDIVNTPFTDSVFFINIPFVKFGNGATRDVAFEASKHAIKQALMVVDPQLADSEMCRLVRDTLKSGGIGVEQLSEIHIEPEDTEIVKAWGMIRDAAFDGIIALGGGSTIDTAKLLNLLHTYPADIMDYVNQPVGAGRPVPGPLKPLIAIPTTAGTGSENTSVAILDISALRIKSGISHPYLRPTVALIDPLNTLTQPPMVTASAGLDVLNHAIESFTAHPYTARTAVTDPAARPVYAGATPVADIFAAEAIRWVHRYLRRAMANPLDVEARYYLMLGASVAGIGFGHAGVHIPHAMGYPIAGLLREWHPPDYDFGYPISPHGISTAIPGAYVFRRLARLDFERFGQINELLGIPAAQPHQVGDRLCEYYLNLLADLGVPTTLGAIGFCDGDLDSLVNGTLAQKRLLALAPKTVTADDLATMFSDAISGL